MNTNPPVITDMIHGLEGSTEDILICTFKTYIATAVASPQHKRKVTKMQLLRAEGRDLYSIEGFPSLVELRICPLNHPRILPSGEPISLSLMRFPQYKLRMDTFCFHRQIPIIAQNIITNEKTGISGRLRLDKESPAMLNAMPISKGRIINFDKNSVKPKEKAIFSPKYSLID